MTDPKKCAHCGERIQARTTYHPVRTPDGRTVGVHPHCMDAHNRAAVVRDSPELATAHAEIADLRRQLAEVTADRDRAAAISAQLRRRVAVREGRWLRRRLRRGRDLRARAVARTLAARVRELEAERDRARADERERIATPTAIEADHHPGTYPYSMARAIRLNVFAAAPGACQAIDPGPDTPAPTPDPDDSDTMPSATEAREELLAAGMDPDAVGARGAALARRLLASRPRMPWPIGTRVRITASDSPGDGVIVEANADGTAYRVRHNHYGGPLMSYGYRVLQPIDHVAAPTPDPDDDAAWPPPRADLSWAVDDFGLHITDGIDCGWWLRSDGVFDGSVPHSLDDPDAPAIEAVLRAREQARRAKAGAT